MSQGEETKMLQSTFGYFIKYIYYNTLLQKNKMLLLDFLLVGQKILQILPLIFLRSGWFPP